MVSHPITYLIDDNEIDSYIARKSLELTHPEDEVIIFHSTEEALMTLKKIDEAAYPRQILLDLHMPIKDGWEFLEAYTALPAYPFNDCKVLILSCSVHPLDRQRARQYACITDFISKPLLDR